MNLDIFGAVTGAFGILWLVLGVVFIWAWWRIFDRAGWEGALSLLYLVPIVNIVLFFVFAFGDWPALDNNSGE